MDLKNLLKIQDNFFICCKKCQEKLFSIEFFNKTDVLHAQTLDQLFFNFHCVKWIIMTTLSKIAYFFYLMHFKTIFIKDK